MAYKFYKRLNEYYFLILPSPNMIHRAEKGVLSSSLNAYLGSIFFMLPDNHWLTVLREASHKFPNSVCSLILSVAIM